MIPQSSYRAKDTKILQFRGTSSAVSEIRRRLKPKRGETVKVDGFEIRWPE